jgi:hypothetical protein
MRALYYEKFVQGHVPRKWERTTVNRLVKFSDSTGYPVPLYAGCYHLSVKLGETSSRFYIRWREQSHRDCQL